MKLQELTFGDIVTFRNGKSIKPGGNGAYPVYGSNGIIGACDDYLYENAIILGRVGAYCGSVERCGGKFWASDNTIVVDPHRDQLDGKFAYYLLLNANLNQHAGGAAQPLLTQSHLKPLRFAIPKMDNQVQISSILSAYDDLIENNTRRIAILEEMARQIFEEWFVHFRAPGCKTLPRIDTPLGPAPAGWEVVPLSRLAKLEGKSVSPNAEPFQIFAHYSYPAFDEGGLPVVEPGSQIQSNKLLFDAGVTLLGKLNPRIQRVWLVLHQSEHSMVTSTEFMPLRPIAPVPNSYLHMTVNNKGFFDALRGLTGGTSTSHQRATPKNVMALPVLMPDEALLGRFETTCGAMLLLMLQLIRQDRNLRAQRDLLLPRLISGEIDVSEAPALLEAAE